ncbi:hypothetical protein [Streptomyces chromofuscus]|uniref:Uncharacterized protein n=1 Tax=Streptomyces chromofuscus TaxID=42881 RepID=A0A7M2T178_STRCW|nr:hypothetical protein [Streptomyces chromofuscus]QOV42336.1 hypothetical protein IPT68_21100 [Streptomyces chromofuscus]GGT34698.1 hypothetical protein GCM10010254_63960 [Streptomyces chromofuscus]
MNLSAREDAAGACRGDRATEERARASVPTVRFDEPEQSEPPGVAHPAALDEPRHGGTRMAPDGPEGSEDAVDTYTVREDDPPCARTRSDRSIRPYRLESGWDPPVRTRSGTQYHGGLSALF